MKELSYKEKEHQTKMKVALICASFVFLVGAFVLFSFCIFSTNKIYKELYFLWGFFTLILCPLSIGAIQIIDRILWGNGE